MNSITVVRAGLLTTIQDGGRWGRQDQGVPVSGPMDPTSMRLANLLVGNSDAEATLEITFQGPELRFDTEADVAVTGADLSASVIDDSGGRHAVTNAVPFRVPAGATLNFGERRHLSRAYVAVRGGLDAPLVLGSRATSMQARLPGLAGRALRAGDILAVGDRSVREPRSLPGDLAARLGHDAAAGAVLRFVWGPDHGLFDEDQRRVFLEATYRVSNASNRMGYRLEGPQVQAAGGGAMLSEATPTGTIQIPPGGEPILLMADRQTTGGYPRIGTVISADIGHAGQLAPGDRISFLPCELEEAVSLLRDRERLLTQVGEPE